MRKRLIISLCVLSLVACKGDGGTSASDDQPIVEQSDGNVEISIYMYEDLLHDVRGKPYLRNILAQVTADGKITQDELVEINEVEEGHQLIEEARRQENMIGDLASKRVFDENHKAPKCFGTGDIPCPSAIPN